MENPSEPVLSEKERKLIQLARQFEGLKLNPAWTTLMEAVRQFRDDALSDIRNCRSSNAQLRSNLLFKYEERSKCIEFIEAYLDGITKARTEIIRSLAEINGHFGEAAEDLVATLDLNRRING